MLMDWVDNAARLAEIGGHGNAAAAEGTRSSSSRRRGKPES
jgi:hypothetical protein